MEQETPTPDSPLQNSGVYDDVIALASVKHQGMLRASTTSLQERIAYIRDMIAIAIPLLVGSIAFLAIAPNRIKTIWLFYVACGLIGVSIFVGSIARIKFIQILQGTVFGVEAWMKNVAESSLYLKYDPSDPVKKKAAADAEDASMQVPLLTWFAENSTKIITIFLLSGLAGIALSLIFKISN